MDWRRGRWAPVAKTPPAEAVMRVFMASRPRMKQSRPSRPREGAAEVCGEKEEEELRRGFGAEAVG